MTGPEIIEQVQQALPAAEAPTPWLQIGLILFGSAVVAWGVTEAVKGTWLRRLKYTEHVDTREAKRRMWWSPLLILVAMVTGTATGALAGSIDWHAGYGALVGASGGALASFLVSVIKGHLVELVRRVLGSKGEGGTE